LVCNARWALAVGRKSCVNRATQLVHSSSPFGVSWCDCAFVPPEVTRSLLMNSRSRAGIITLSRKSLSQGSIKGSTLGAEMGFTDVFFSLLIYEVCFMSPRRRSHSRKASPARAGSLIRCPIACGTCWFASSRISIIETVRRHLPWLGA